MATSEYVVERTVETTASPEQVAALIVDLHRWPIWSPWEKLDPGMSRTYSGSKSGVGASCAWSGNRKAGQGNMTITAVDPARIDVAVEFVKPFPSTSVSSFLLRPTATGTTVVWRMTGAKHLMMRLLGPLFSMDKLIGGDLAEGLASLAQAAQSEQG